MIKKFTQTTLALILAGYSLYSQDIHSAPIINPFSLSGNNLGAISNSVNLFTGDLALPLSLVSIPGREGIGIDVSIFYSSSNIENLATTWNLDAPTSTLGLGWSMPSSQIVVDNKQTAAREDDEYYLSDNGSSVRLICVGNTSGVKSYKTKSYSNKIITFTASSERWDITLENGTTLIYGNPSNGRNAVQWTVALYNWIGNTNQTPTLQQGIAWSLTEMTNIWGDKVYYSYQKVENSVGTGGPMVQTEASYVSMITDTQGHEVDFVYKNKLAEEVMEPHTEQNEPDAYQERYEKQYLDRIFVKGDGTSYYEIDFRYTFKTGSVSFGNITKRLLTSIVKIASTGLQIPAMTFGYQASGPMAGALNSVTTSSGGIVVFEYSPSGVQIAHPSTSMTLTAPSGYKEPQISVADDYTIVTWRQLNGTSHDATARPFQLFAYSWEGEWIATSLTANMPVAQVKSNSTTYQQDYLITTQKNFFAILLPDYTIANTYYVYIWKKSETANGAWSFFYDDITLSTGSDPTQKQLLSGNNFIAVTDNYGKIFRYTNSGGLWIQTPITESAGTHSTVVANNYVISHNTATNPDQINFYYLNEQVNWATPISVTTTWNNGSGPAYWYASNSHAMVMPSGLNAYVYQWDNNYNNIAKYDLGCAYNSDVPIYFTESLVGIGRTSTARGRAYRFNGLTWVDSGVKNADYDVNFLDAFGEDMMAWVQPNQYSLFSPNTNTWYKDSTNSHTSTLQIGGGFNILNGNYNYTKPDGTWYQQAMTPPFYDNNWSFTGPRFFINNGYMYYLKNGIVLGSNNLGTYSNTYYYSSNTCCVPNFMVGLNSLALACTGTMLIDCSSLTLLRADPVTLNNSISVDYPIDKITTNDGLRNNYTSFKYEPTTAMMDPSRSVAQYNKVTTVAASASVASFPSGYTETYFFNGVSDTELSDTYPSQNSPSYPASSNYKLLTGQVYRTKAFDSGSNLVSQSDISFAVVPISLYNPSVIIATSFQPLVVGTITTQDNIQVISNKNYLANGQLNTQVDYTNSGGTSVESITTTYKYAWQVYPSSVQARNILSAPFQVTRNVNSQDVVSSVTRYREDWPCTSPTCTYSTVPAAYDQFAWKSTNTTSFSWYNISTQTPSTDWDFQGMVSARDSYNGVETETKSKGNQYTAQLWDQYRRTPLASVSNAQSTLVAYTSFEDASLGNWSWTDGSIVTGASKTGNRYYTLGTVGISKAGLSTSDTYTVSFWSNSSGGAVTISGVGTVNLGTLTGWTLFQYNITNVSGVTIAKSGGTAVQIDEVRIMPSNAQMSSATYHPLFGPTSKTNVNNQTSYMVYDGLGRPLNSQDENNNIVKNIIYNTQK